MTMKMFNTYLALVVFSIASEVLAAPFVVADVESGADVCTYRLGTAAGVDVPVVVDTVNGNPATANRVCKIDVGTAPAGPNTINLSAKSLTWGTVSAAVPFSFARPAQLGAPASIRLVP